MSLGVLLKKLEKDIFKKVLILFIGVFFILYIVSYALFKSFILELSEEKAYSLEKNINEFNFIWMEVGSLFVVLLLVVLYVLRGTLKEILYDINELIEYTKEISQNKNYEAVHHVKHYIEFLHISAQMKNIIKRLHKKDKK